MQGDASTRIFERLILDDQTTIFMNAPPKPDGPPVRDGKPYSAIAHLAEDMFPMSRWPRDCASATCRHRNLCTPTRRTALSSWKTSARTSSSLAIHRRRSRTRYEAALDLLISLHRRKLPENLPVAPHLDYRLPRYDIDALPDRGRAVARLVSAGDANRRQSRYANLLSRCGARRWRRFLKRSQTWVLRDFHSPNLLWLSDREDVARIGVLDFQDALIGPPAYDVASLLQDARVDVPGRWK